MDPLAVAVLFAGMLAASLAVTLVVRLVASLLGRWRTATASRLEPPLEAFLGERAPRAGATPDQ